MFCREFDKGVYVSRLTTSIGLSRCFSLAIKSLALLEFL